MQHPVRRALTVALAAGGFALLGSTAAQGMENTVTGLVEDVATDVVATTPINASVDVSCNNVAVLSDGTSTECTGDNTGTASTGDVTSAHADASPEASDTGLVEDVVTDVVATAPVNAPVDVSCNNVNVLGSGGSTECTGDNTDTTSSGEATTGGTNEASAEDTDHGVVEDVVTEAVAATPVNAPVDVSCNNVTVLGHDNSSTCTGNASDTATSGEPTTGGTNAAPTEDTDHGLVEDVVTDVLATAPVNAPVDASCNNVTVLGHDNNSTCTGNDSDTATSGDTATGDASADDGSDHGLVKDVVTDVVVTAPVNTPVDASCNNVTALGHGSTTECTGNDTNTAASGESTTGGTNAAPAEEDTDHGLVEDVVTDVVVTAPVNTPVDASCNNVTVLGHDNGSTCTGNDTDSAAGGDIATGDSGTTHGADHGLLEDVAATAVATAPVNAPVDASCNNVTVLGHDNGSTCTGNDTDTAASGAVTTGEPGTSQGSDESLLDDVVTDVVVITPVNAPVDASCNTVAVLGQGNTTECTGNDTDTSGVMSTGDDGTETPAQPDEPATPGTPGEPGEPGEPGDPADSEEPATPAPSEPGDSDDPRDGQNASTPGTTDRGDARTPTASGSAGAGLLMAGTTGTVHLRAGQATVGQPAPPAAPSADRLAMTGSEQAPLALLALLLVGAGALLLRRSTVAVTG